MLLAGDTDGAAARYRTLAASTLDEDFGRNLEVKALAAAEPVAREAIVPLLLGTPGRPPDPFVGPVRLGEWNARGNDPVAHYLVGRNLANHGFWLDGVAELDRALAWGAGPPMTPRLSRELLRIYAVCECAMRNAAGIAFVRGLVEATDSPFAGTAGGRREYVVRLLERCR
jgi:hypothetical protein